MSWKSVRLIFRREMRDQLRDRRTLFMIAVLPVLFYPLLGVCIFQIMQFLQEHPSQVLVIGHEETKGDLPALIDLDNEQFSSDVFPEQTNLVKLIHMRLGDLRFVKRGKWPEEGDLTPELREELNKELRLLMELKECEAVVCFPPNFFRELQEYPKRLKAHKDGITAAAPRIPTPALLVDNSTDKTGLASVRVNRALQQPYEPGSTFKMVPLAAALTRDRVHAADVFHCGNGQMRESLSRG